MKRTGVIILIVGLVIVIFTGFNFFTGDKIVAIGDLKMLENDHSLAWSPLVGVAAIAVSIGIGVYLIGSKK